MIVALDESVRNLEALMKRRRGPEFYLLDEELRVVFESPDASMRALGFNEHLLESARELVRRTEAAGSSSSEWELLQDGAITRAVRVRGGGLNHSLIFVERPRARAWVSDAASRFKLSNREAEVFCLLLRGRNTKEVANELSIAASTARDHIVRIMQKTRCRTRAELLAMAIDLQSNG